MLKDCLKLVLNRNLLPDEDYQVFKNMTRYSFVESSKLRERLKQAKKPVGRLCYPSDFRKYVRELKPSIVERNIETFGIPQGTPLSGLYANISMLFADENISAYCNSLGGSYRRYSDDLAIVVPAKINPDTVLKSVSNILGAIGLNINSRKTEISKFSQNKTLESDRPFQYLGFVFDGNKVLIRQSFIHNYYKK